MGGRQRTEALCSTCLPPGTGVWRCQYFGEVAGRMTRVPHIPTERDFTPRMLRVACTDRQDFRAAGMGDKSDRVARAHTNHQGSRAALVPAFPGEGRT
jgi:hypothetical protein